jgi:hypothetical protein
LECPKLAAVFDIPKLAAVFDMPKLAAVFDSISVVVHWHNTHLVLVLVVDMHTWERSYPGLVLGRMKHSFVAVHIQLGLVGVCRTALHKSGVWAGGDKQLSVAAAAAAAAVADNQRGLGQVRVRVRVRVLRVHSIA